MSSTAVKIAERALPEVFSVVLKAGGWEALERFAKVLGGRRVHIPVRPVGDHHLLVAAGGRAVADALVARYGGRDKWLQIPRGSHSLKLLWLKDNLDMTNNEVARTLGCTFRHVSNLRKETQVGGNKRPRGRPAAPRDPRQIDLEDLLR